MMIQSLNNARVWTPTKNGINVYGDVQIMADHPDEWQVSAGRPDKRGGNEVVIVIIFVSVSFDDSLLGVFCFFIFSLRYRYNIYYNNNDNRDDCSFSFEI